MREAAVALETADGPMAAYVAFPDGEAPAAAVIVVQEAFGVNDHIRAVARRVANAGYLAIAPELYHRRGAGIELRYDDLPSMRAAMATLDNDAIAVDLRAAAAWLRAHPRGSGRVGVVGFCLGGFAAFLAACRLDLDSHVAFYGGGIVRAREGLKLTPLLDEACAIHAPLLLHFGINDSGIPPADVEAIRARLDGLAKNFAIAQYPAAGHGFFCDGRASFQPVAAFEAWQRTATFLKQTLESDQRSGK